MKRYNISVPKTYTKDGEEKTAWTNVGTLVRFEPTEEKPEGYIMELNMFPQTKFGVFEQKPKVEGQQTERPPVRDTMTSKGVNGEQINSEEIPF